MLTRLKLRKDFRIVVRLLSDKPPESEGKMPPVQDKKGAKDDAKPDTDKINSILKTMIDNFNSSKVEPSVVDSFIAKKRKPNTDEFRVEKIEENLTEAAGIVAKALGGNVKQTESELLSKVLGKINQTPTELSQLLVGMKVNRNAKDSDDYYKYETRGDQVKRLVGKARDTHRDKPNQRRPQQAFREQRSPVQLSTVDVFSGEPLGIFSKSLGNYGTKLETWEKLEERELTLATAQPPANYFQKMIMWTEQGKVWKFPINNEQGLEDEENVHFSEHIFLETQLDGWCPTKGPIRHFMELVCTGLSKNSFYTAQEKREHILWYKDYFETKQDVLKEVGVWIVENNDQTRQTTT